jgi:hypothetical protein
MDRAWLTHTQEFSMTKSVEAARAYVQAHDALVSPEHLTDVEILREVSNRVREREANAKAAQEALFGAHADEVASGEAQPADNTEAARVILLREHDEDYLGPKQSLVLPESLNGYGHTYDPDVFDDFTPPARAD